MRKYNIDAYRNMGDLKLKVLTNWEYNNLLLTCYDTAFLWLADAYYKAPNGNYEKLDELNLLTLVKVLSTRSAFIEANVKGYDRLYFIYELVYRNYFTATKLDVIEAIKTLDRIVRWWCDNCVFKSLRELAIHMYPDKTDEINDMQDNTFSRKQLASLLNMNGTLENSWKLLESSDE